jgi:ribonucleoside-diphosphate reductase alpha chain
LKTVKKRNGDIVPLDLEKYHKMIEWICEGLNNVSPSEIEISSKIQFVDGVSTSDIHKITTKAIADLISERSPNYQYAAARSLLMDIRKELFGTFKPTPLLETVKKNIASGHYENILEYYTEEEINYLDSKINHDKDFTFTYSGLRTVVDKFIVQDRVKDKLLESPQMLFMLVPAVMFKNEKEDRLKQVVSYYNDLSDFYISLPSPIMSGLRTPIKGYSSCCLIDAGDSTKSLTSATSAAVVMTTIKAGIGLSNSGIRGIGAPVANGTVIHTGIVKMLQWFQSAVKAFSQGSRGGGATSYHMCWNWEIEKIINLKSNKSTEENSAKGLDYGIGFPDLFFKRLEENKEWTLFSAEETQDLMTNLYDTQLWEKTYIDYENKKGIRKKKINAREFFKDYATQYFETGRIYPLFVSAVNKGPLKSVIKMSNLCSEIALPVKPLEHLYDENGEIALCILSNVNAGKLKSIDQLPDLTYKILKGLDNIIDIQEYPLPAAENSTINARYVGVGTSDWAHYLTKYKVRYNTQEALDLAEEFAEHMQFNLLKASVRLSKERGEAPWFRERSKYADGWLPNDGKWRFISHEDWEALRADIIKYGLRHLTLSAIPPAGTSSDVSGSTSGIDMPRDFLVSKSSKSGPVKQIVPNFSRGSAYYTLAKEVDNLKYLEMISKFQLYVDQSISTNVWWSASDFDKDGNFPIGKLVKAMVTAHKLGLKTMYYSNFLEEDVNLDKADESCTGGGCSV